MATKCALCDAPPHLHSLQLPDKHSPGCPLSPSRDPVVVAVVVERMREGLAIAAWLQDLASEDGTRDGRAALLSAAWRITQGHHVKAPR